MNEHGLDPTTLPRSASPDTRISAPAASLFVRRRMTDDPGREILRRPSISYWQDARQRLWRNKVAVAAGIYIVLLAIAAVVVPEVLPYAPDEQEIWNKHRLPTLGEDALVVDSSGGLRPVELDEAVAPELLEPVDAFDPPPVPASVRIIGEPLTTSVALAWEPVPGVEGYRIYRSSAADTFGVPIDDVPADRAAFLDTSSFSPGAEVFYHIVAFNPFGDSVTAATIGVRPKLALELVEARKLDPGAEVGRVVRTRAHFLGTDYLGRDMLSRVLAGARVSLTIGILAPLLYILIGIIWGSIAGYFGGLLDDAMMRVADVVSTIPELLIVILLQVVLGSGVTTLIIAMVAVAWARSAQQIRGEVLRLRHAEFVQAARILGTSFRRTVFRHLLPNVMGTVLVLLTLAVPGAIFTEAFLSFIGLGIHPPMTSWGIVAKEGARAFLTYPHQLLIPSALICATMLAFNLLGDGLRDALDPKLRGTR